MQSRATNPSNTSSSDGARLLANWQRAHKLPFGKWVFSLALGHTVPYSGSIRPSVRQLAPGLAEVEISDRKPLRNHLGSLHAIAIANLCELASDLALQTALPADTRSILVDFSITFLKKARGRIRALSRAEPIKSNDTADVTVAVEARDSAAEVVAVAKAVWRVGPRK